MLLSRGTVIRLAIASAAMILLGAVLVFFFAPASSAAPIVNTPDGGGKLVAVADQQTILTDATGRATLSLLNGEKSQACLDTERIEVFTIQKAGNKSGGRDPMSVQTAQNTNCTIRLRFFDINDEPITNNLVRLGYEANGQVQTRVTDTELEETIAELEARLDALEETESEEEL